jgi:hypothetical protein
MQTPTPGTRIYIRKITFRAIAPEAPAMKPVFFSDWFDPRTQKGRHVRTVINWDAYHRAACRTQIITTGGSNDSFIDVRGGHR